MYDRETIRDANPIEDVISADVDLRRRGRYLWGLCPFHPDQRPSFSVSVGSQRFRCWGCDEHGGVFRYLMVRDGVTFGHSIRTLAERAGLGPEPTTSSDSRSQTARSHPWPPTPAERRQTDRNLAEAYAEIELRLAGSLRQRWTEADRKLHLAGVDADQFTPLDLVDDAKLAALDDHYRMMDRFDRDEHALEGMSRQRRRT